MALIVGAKCVRGQQLPSVWNLVYGRGQQLSADWSLMWVRGHKLISVLRLSRQQLLTVGVFVFKGTTAVLSVWESVVMGTTAALSVLLFLVRGQQLSSVWG